MDSLSQTASNSHIQVNPNGGSILTAEQVFASLDQSIDIARKKGDLNMYESHSTEVLEHGVKYQIRICPALQKRHVPTSSVAPESGGMSKVVGTIVKEDPFLPPFTSLLIGEMKDELEQDGEGYNVLLNKFAVVHGHFLLVTKEYQSQAHPLTPSQLVQTYLLLLAAQSRHQPYFAFFNCGEFSGASQPHKHIQFIPGEAPIDRVAKAARVENEARAFVVPKLPFAAHIKRLDRSVISSASAGELDSDVLDRLSAELSMGFMAILDEMYHTIRVRAEHERQKQEQGSSTSASIESKGSSSPSYNIVMTLEHIYLFPRSAEKFIQNAEGEENKTQFDLSVNSLGYAGMLLVKSKDELEKVKGVGIGRILSQVGMEPLKEEDDKGCDDVFADLA